MLQNLVLFQIGMKPKFQHFSMKGKALGSLHFWQAAEQGRVLETLSLLPKGFPCDWQDWDLKITASPIFSEPENHSISHFPRQLQDCKLVIQFIIPQHSTW